MLSPSTYSVARTLIKDHEVSVLIVGAGATGGYLGAQLIAGGRDVTFLVRPTRQAAFEIDGLQIRRGEQIESIAVNAVTPDTQAGTYDTVVVALRRDAVKSLITDLDSVLGQQTRIVPLLNGIRHISVLAAAFGEDRVLASTAKLIARQLHDGVIDVIVPGIRLEVGQLDGSGSTSLDATAAELSVAGVNVAIRGDGMAAMWEKFAFITSTAMLTCLVRVVIGAAAHAKGGSALAHDILTEVSTVAAAEGYPLDAVTRTGLNDALTDTSSGSAPSMFRDLQASRPVEIEVFGDMWESARQQGLSTPLLGAMMVAVEVHNRRIAAAQSAASESP
jgi:2-dehydropantoate 2-reductase